MPVMKTPLMARRSSLDQVGMRSLMISWVLGLDKRLFYENSLSGT